MLVVMVYALRGDPAPDQDFIKICALHQLIALIQDFQPDLPWDREE